MTARSRLSRRRFLAQGTAFALPLLLPSEVLAKPSRNNTVRLGFVGTERRGQQLLETLPEVGRASSCRQSDLSGSSSGSNVSNDTYLRAPPSFHDWLGSFQYASQADRLAFLIAQAGAARRIP